ncbi:hypothetical protein ACFL1S_00060 [Pseudomonadota bacterium]
MNLDKSLLIRLVWLSIWLVCGTVAYLVVFRTIDASMFDGRYYPVYGDSFYHARRILDVYHGAVENFHFDPRINAPDGMWVSWPWLYDTAMAYLLKAASSVPVQQSIEFILFSIPSLWVYANIGLATVLLYLFRVNVALAATALLCLAASPAMLRLHSFGRVDHHFAELTVLLGVSITAIQWLRNPGHRGRAIVCGAALGIAPAIHNGLFILYAPVLATVFVAWCRGSLRLTMGDALWFSLASVFVLLAMLGFSEPFRQGFFSFYFFSWFHLYVATAVCLSIMYMTGFSFTFGRLAILIIGGLAVLAPLVNEVLRGYEWVGADVPYLSKILEMRPLFFRFQADIPNVLWLVSNIGAFALLFPISFVAALYFIFRSSDDGLVLLSFVFLLSITLWLHQQRFEYFGVPLLILFCTVALDWLIGKLRKKRAPRILAISAAAGLFLLSTPVLVNSEASRVRPSMGMVDYPVAVSLLLEAAPFCEEDPGILLVETHFGHLVRYLTECSAISTMMLISSADFEKANEMEALLRATPDEIARDRPDIKYALVLKTSFAVPGREKTGISFNVPPLVEALLDPEFAADSVRELKRLNVRRAGREDAYGALYKFVR